MNIIANNFLYKVIPPIGNAVIDPKTGIAHPMGIMDVWAYFTTFFIVLFLLSLILFFIFSILFIKNKKKGNNKYRRIVIVTLIVSILFFVMSVVPSIYSMVTGTYCYTVFDYLFEVLNG